MPEKVIGGGFLVPGAAEFNEAIARLWQELGYINENKRVNKY